MRSPHAPLDAVRKRWRRRRYHGRHYRRFEARHRTPAGASRHRAPGGPPHRRLSLARRRPVAALAMILLALAYVTGSALGAVPDPAGSATPTGTAAVVTAGASTLLQERLQSTRALSRAAERVPSPPADTRPDGAAPEVSEAPPSRALRPEPSPATTRGVARTGTPPVGGLSQQQMDHAARIVAAGQRAGLPERAYVVAIATALQESNLRNLANPAVSASLNLPHDGTGFDHDSVGLFQQRSSTGWGPVADLMDPDYAATRFYRALARVPGWERMPVTVAAQSVQRSAFPYHYAKHEPLAREIVAALTP